MLSKILHVVTQTTEGKPAKSARACLHHDTACRSNLQYPCEGAGVTTVTLCLGIAGATIMYGSVVWSGQINTPLWSILVSAKNGENQQSFSTD